MLNCKKLIKDIKLNIKALASLVLIMSYPLMMIVVIGWFLIPHLMPYLREVVAFVFFTSVFIGLILVAKSVVLKKWVMIFSLWMLSVFAFVKLGFYYIFGAKLSSSSVFVFFETNYNEASEFISSYFDAKLIVLAFFSFIYPILYSCIIGFNLKKFYLSSFHLHSNKIRLLSVLLIFLSVIALQRRFKAESIVFTLSKSIEEYKETKANIRKDLAQETNPNLSVIANKTDSQVGVVIIGEATSRWHMQLYGYNRETNPLLMEIKDELLVFNDVIAPNVMTIRSLEKALTLKCYEGFDVENNFSVVQLANQSDFETFWISNQEPVGYTESIPTIIGSAAKTKEFIATDDYSHTIYDENLLPRINSALKSKEGRKIIFVHLIGTHRVYSKRYPDEYSHFKGVNERTKYKTEYSKDKVNEYDNAIRYNDYVVREIIEQVRSMNENSFVVYFSDHGDDVFDTQDFVGHHGNKASKPMHDIPFLAWFSESYKLKNPRFDSIFNNLDKPHALEDFIYGFSDLIDVDYKAYDSSRSIFNKDYKIKTRWIRNEIDYDKW